MKTALIALLSVAHLIITGCAPLPPVPPADAPVQQCLVCRYKRDFACLTVPATPGTPHTNHAGRTYWFCSENCCAEFKKSPAQFVPKR
jgi:YHS domain-containing protein